MMRHAEEDTANLEIISVLIVAVGMFLLTFSKLAGNLIIMAASGSLVLIYSFRFVTGTKEQCIRSRLKNLSGLNNIILVVGILLMTLTAFSFYGSKILRIAAAALLTFSFIINLTFRNSWHNRYKLAMDQLRILLVFILILLYYFFPIKPKML